METLSRGMGCVYPRCSRFATHEESYDGGDTWKPLCEDHRTCGSEQADKINVSLLEALVRSEVR